jgi:hypothetical protein
MALPDRSKPQQTSIFPRPIAPDLAGTGRWLIHVGLRPCLILTYLLIRSVSPTCPCGFVFDGVHSQVPTLGVELAIMAVLSFADDSRAGLRKHQKAVASMK